MPTNISTNVHGKCHIICLLLLWYSPHQELLFEVIREYPSGTGLPVRAFLPRRPTEALVGLRRSHVRPQQLRRRIAMVKGLHAQLHHPHHQSPGEKLILTLHKIKLIKKLSKKASKNSSKATKNSSKNTSKKASKKRQIVMVKGITGEKKRMKTDPTIHYIKGTIHILLQHVFGPFLTHQPTMSAKWQFLNPPTQSFCWCNMYMDDPLNKTIMSQL